MSTTSFELPRGSRTVCSASESFLLRVLETHHGTATSLLMLHFPYCPRKTNVLLSFFLYECVIGIAGEASEQAAFITARYDLLFISAKMCFKTTKMAWMFRTFVAIFLFDYDCVFNRQMCYGKWESLLLSLHYYTEWRFAHFNQASRSLWLRAHYQIHHQLVLHMTPR